MDTFFLRGKIYLCTQCTEGLLLFMKLQEGVGRKQIYIYIYIYITHRHKRIPTQPRPHKEATQSRSGPYAVSIYSLGQLELDYVRMFLYKTRPMLIPLGRRIVQLQPSDSCVIGQYVHLGMRRHHAAAAVGDI